MQQRWYEEYTLLTLPFNPMRRTTHRVRPK